MGLGGWAGGSKERFTAKATSQPYVRVNAYSSVRACVCACVCARVRVYVGVRGRVDGRNKRSCHGEADHTARYVICVCGTAWFGGWLGRGMVEHEEEENEYG